MEAIHTWEVGVLPILAKTLAMEAATGPIPHLNEQQL
jgi:hypothetical protein